MVLLNQGVTHYKTGDYAAAGAALERSLEIGVEGGWIHRQCFANIALGNVRRLQRDFQAARRHLHTAYGQAQQLQYPREEALALEFLGDVYRDEEQPAEARRFYTRALAIARAMAPEGDIVMEVHRRTGDCLYLEGKPRPAAVEFERALALARAQGDRFEAGTALRGLALTAAVAGETAAARSHIDRAIGLHERIGARHELALSRLTAAELALAEWERDGEGAALDRAWDQATAALDQFVHVGVPWWTERARQLVERVAHLRRERERAGAEAAADRAADGAAAYAPGEVIIHAGGRMRDLLQLCDIYAAADEPVLITGETGTGKELIARRLHRHGDRGAGPLVTVNVAAIPATLFEREFFGHVKGSFSGADSDREGFAARADGGTLFLDEIGDLPLAAQPKLLRLLQEGTFQALGDPRERRTDLRLVAATNADLAKRVEAGAFRADLYYRLRVLEMKLPPLRERPEDVPVLLRHFLSLAEGRPVPPTAYFNVESLSAMAGYRWPGNVREVAMVARRAVMELRSRGRLRIELEGEAGDVVVLDGPGPRPLGLRGGAARAEVDPPAGDPVERSRILTALRESGGNRQEAARLLGVGRSTLYRRMEKLGIRIPRK